MFFFELFLGMLAMGAKQFSYGSHLSREWRIPVLSPCSGSNSPVVSISLGTKQILERTWEFVLETCNTTSWSSLQEFLVNEAESPVVFLQEVATDEEKVRLLKRPRVFLLRYLLALALRRQTGLTWLSLRSGVWHGLFCAAAKLATKHELAAKSDRGAKWRTWVAEAVSDGASKARKYSKPSIGWIPSTSLQGAPPPGPRQQVDELLEAWKGVWKPSPESEAMPEPVAYCTSLLQQLASERGASVEDLCPPVRDPEAIGRVASMFKRFTALGIDALHPRELANLSDGALKCLALLWRWQECSGIFSSAIALILLAQLPKPEGGYRPVGIESGVSWGFHKIARHEAVEWEDRHPRSYHYGVKGKSCERAAWEQSLAVENHSLTGFTAGLALLDLTKAHEKVVHFLLVQAAVAWHFQIFRLRLLIAKYRGPRVLSLSGVCSDVVHSSQTILAGCPFATTLLRLFLLSPLGKVCEHFPPAVPFNVVDDIALFMGGGAAKVVQTRLGNATAYLGGLLEGLQLVVSESKGKVLSPRSSAARGLAKRPSKWKFTAPAATRNLGCDFGAGPKGRRSRAVVGSRFRKIKGRLSKFRSLRSSFQGPMKVIRGGAPPQGMYGAMVKGWVDPATLRRCFEAAERCPSSAWSDVRGPGLLMEGARDRAGDAGSSVQGRLWQWALRWGGGPAPARRLGFWRWALGLPPRGAAAGARGAPAEAVLRAAARVDAQGLLQLSHGLAGTPHGLQVAAAALERLAAAAGEAAAGGLPTDVLEALMGAPLHAQRCWLLSAEALPWLVLQCRCFQIAIAAHRPLLFRHLLAEGVAPELFYCSWIQGLFAACAPGGALARLWDLWVFEGSHKVFVRTAVAVFGLLEKRMLGKDVEFIMRFLRDPEAWQLDEDTIVTAALETKVTRSMLRHFEEGPAA
ncbi:unnamed protein product [Prorocentrum cordatum]|uniref:Rab-GAP TBC domain-containing protein n=1 Tax=Prorocentrum cordatum TaxID=2364126 RepID=A0ABN9RDA5_9DINO|nr:unnamed protein product [Polarella glacialis]